MNIFKEIKCFISLINNKLILVRYKRIPKPSFSVSGYRDVDLKTISKRYLNSSMGVNENKLLSIGAFNDLHHFLGTDCRNEFNKKKKWNILDVGCGSGVYSKLFKGKSFPFGQVNYEGCEMNQTLVQTCKIINPDIYFFVSLSHRIKAPNNFYDIVFSSSVLHYTLTKWKETLDEFARISKKYILLTRIPFSKYYPTFYVKQSVLGLNGSEMHNFIVINRDEFEEYLKKLGLKIIARDYSSEEYGISGIKEKIILSEYLLVK